jgi:hypothetical protein
MLARYEERRASFQVGLVATLGSHTARVYRKVIDREYTDASLRHLKPVPPQWQHLGLSGPVLRASVGDTTIRVVFQNNTHRPYSIHSHGVFYKKDCAGIPYNDGTTRYDKSDDAVPPSKRHTCVWPVRWMAVRSSGCTTRTSTKCATPIAACSGRLLSPGAT